MSIGNGSHWEGPLLGSDKGQGGLCEDVPIEIQNRRFRVSQLYDWMDQQEDDQWTLTQLGANGTGTITSTGANGDGGFIRLAGSAVDDAGVGSFQPGVNVIVTVAAGYALD